MADPSRELQNLRLTKGVSAKLSVFRQLEKEVKNEESKVEDEPVTDVAAAPPRREFKRAGTIDQTPTSAAPASNPTANPPAVHRQFKRAPDAASTPTPAEAPLSPTPAAEASPPRREFKRAPVTPSEHTEPTSTPGSTSDEIQQLRDELAAAHNTIEQLSVELESLQQTIMEERAQFQQKLAALEEERADFEAEREIFMSQRAAASAKVGGAAPGDSEKALLDAERIQIEAQKRALVAEKAVREAEKLELEAARAAIQLKEQAIAAQLEALASGGQVAPVAAATPVAATTGENDSELHRKLERYKREYLKYKQELKKIKKLQIDTAAQNNSLINEMQKKDRAAERTEKRLAAEVKGYRTKLKTFFQERQQLKDEKRLWEDTKFSLEEPPKPNPNEHWDNPEWLAKERTRVNVVKRYVETERKRFLEVKRAFEQQQAELWEKKKIEDTILTEPEPKSTTTKTSKSSRKVTTTSSHKKQASKVPKSPREPSAAVTPAIAEAEPSTESLNDTPSTAVEAKTPANMDSPQASTDAPDTETIDLMALKASVSPDQESPDLHAPFRNATFESDVFQLQNLNVITCNPVDLQSRVEKLEDMDMQSIRADEQTGEIFSGHLRGLLRAIASQEESEDYHTTFLMTHDYFISAALLLKTIIMFYRSPYVSVTVQDIPENELRPIYQSRLIDFINLWITLRFDVLQKHYEWHRVFTEFVGYLVESPEVNKNHAIALTNTFKKLEQQWQYYRERQVQLMIKTPFGPPNTVQFIYISAQQLAEQLTLREQSYFQVISMHEYYGKSWESLHATNLTKLITRFADMSYWVATTIIMAQDIDGKPSEKYRAQTISRFIHTMEELFHLNNFNTLMQIFTALNMPTIDRLHKSWSQVPQADKEIMKKIGSLMHHSSNYRKYREALDSVEDEPCIPFHSLLLRDLTFIEEDPSFLDDRSINFEKMTLISQIFERLQDFRLQLYEVEEDSGIQLFLHNKIVKSQEELDSIVASLDEEVPGAVAPSVEMNASVQTAADSFMRQHGVPSLELEDCLCVPDIFNQFKAYLSTLSAEDQYTAECWRALYDFTKADFGDSEYARMTLREMAEDIFYQFLTPDSNRYIGGVPDEIISELADIFKNDSVPIQHNLFDEVIAGVLDRMEDPWYSYKTTHLGIAM